MMLKYTFGLSRESEAVENAVKKVLSNGYRTGDIMSEGKTLCTTSEIGDLITSNI